MRARIALTAPLFAVGAIGIAGMLRGDPGSVSYARDVQPIFDRSCTSCHPISYPYLDLRRGRSYAQLVGVPAATNMAFERVLPGRPDLSYLLTHPPDPSNAALLSTSDRVLIKRWIASGAPNN